MIARREFIHRAVVSSVAVAAAPHSLYSVQGKSEVVVGKGTAEKIIPKIVEKMGGMQRFVKKGSRVLIKPNMSFANPPEWGTTTSPQAVRTVVQLCLKAGARRVIIADNTLRDPELCKKNSGIEKAVSDLKGAVVFTPTQENLYTEKTSDSATMLTRVKVLKQLDKIDTLINVPAAKSHGSGGVSLGLKGQMGLITNRWIVHSEMDLHTGIAELLYYIKPSLTIVDATRALLDNGPAGPGTVAELNTFVGGLDPVATDSYAVTLASWYGQKFEGKQVKYLKVANELGLGNVESASITETTV
jgi:uncharacterized protein (DUF362 family)